MVKNRLAIAILDGGGMEYTEICASLDDFTRQISRECFWKVYGALTSDTFPLIHLPYAMKQVESCLRNYLKYPHGTPIEKLGVPPERGERRTVFSGRSAAGDGRGSASGGRG